ncbi:MAG: glycosyltransferase [Lachnospiraceae bacterium]|nr:glycosyltransferase [Lachnospiraceae bacterium]
MIFITVGTHEQPFNRLLEYIDELKGNGTIVEEVIMQTGFSTYEPKYCKWKKLFSFAEMNEYVERARIVITHGGPSSFIMPLQVGKIPIVVPRQKKYNEHVNDHQIVFCREVARRQGNIIEVEEMKRLGEVITQYDSLVAGMDVNRHSNNEKFCEEFEKLVDRMFHDE